MFADASSFGSQFKNCKKAKDQSDFDIQVFDIYFDIFCLQSTLLAGLFVPESPSNWCMCVMSRQTLCNYYL